MIREASPALIHTDRVPPEANGPGRPRAVMDDTEAETGAASKRGHTRLSFRSEATDAPSRAAS